MVYTVYKLKISKDVAKIQIKDNQAKVLHKDMAVKNKVMEDKEDNKDMVNKQVELLNMVDNNNTVNNMVVSSSNTAKKLEVNTEVKGEILMVDSSNMVGNNNTVEVNNNTVEEVEVMVDSSNNMAEEEVLVNKNSQAKNKCHNTVPLHHHQNMAQQDKKILVQISKQEKCLLAVLEVRRKKTFTIISWNLDRSKIILFKEIKWQDNQKVLDL